jgi:hypothetical protein
MSADGSIELEWAEETRRFRIAIGEFRGLQDAVNGRRSVLNLEPSGPSGLLNLLRTNNAWPDDVRDVLKAGLIGGGLEYSKVQRLLIRHFDNSPLLAHMKVAFTILLAALVGVPGDESVSKKKTETATIPDEMNQSSSPSSTETVPQ